MTDPNLLNTAFMLLAFHRMRVRRLTIGDDLSKGLVTMRLREDYDPDHPEDCFVSDFDDTADHTLETDPLRLKFDFWAGLLASRSVGWRFSIPKISRFKSETVMVAVRFFLEAGFKLRISKFMNRDQFHYSYYLEVVLWQTGREEAILSLDLNDENAELEAIEENRLKEGGLIFLFRETGPSNYKLYPVGERPDRPLHEFLAIFRPSDIPSQSESSDNAPAIAITMAGDPYGVIRILQKDKLRWVFVPLGLPDEDLVQFVEKLARDLGGKNAIINTQEFLRDYWKLSM